MASEDYPWTEYFSNPALPKPSITKTIYDLKNRELTDPIFVCLLCTKESTTQQAMAAPCKKHVQSGVTKGTVRHVKYYPDDKYSLLCYNPQPCTPPPASASADEVLLQPPNRTYQDLVPVGNYNPILPYSGSPFMSLLAASFTHDGQTHDGPTQDFISRIGTLPTLGNLGQRLPAEAGSSSSNGFGATMSQNYNYGFADRTPNGVTPNLDLTLGLNSTPGTAADDATMHATDRD